MEHSPEKLKVSLTNTTPTKIPVTTNCLRLRINVYVYNFYKLLDTAACRPPSCPVTQDRKEDGWDGDRDSDINLTKRYKTTTEA